MEDKCHGFGVSGLIPLLGRKKSPIPQTPHRLKEPAGRAMALAVESAVTSLWPRLLGSGLCPHGTPATVAGGLISLHLLVSARRLW